MSGANLKIRQSFPVHLRFLASLTDMHRFSTVWHIREYCDIHRSFLLIASLNPLTEGQAPTPAFQCERRCMSRNQIFQVTIRLRSCNKNHSTPLRSCSKVMCCNNTGSNKFSSIKNSILHCQPGSIFAGNVVKMYLDQVSGIKTFSTLKVSTLEHSERDGPGHPALPKFASGHHRIKQSFV